MKFKYKFFLKFRPIFGVYKTRVKIMLSIMAIYFLSVIFMSCHKNFWSISISLFFTLLFLSVTLMMVFYDQIDFNIKYASNDEEYEIKKMLTKYK